MRTKFVITVILAIVTLVIWINWSSKNEFDNTIFIIKQNHYFKRDAFIEPSHTICKQNLFILIIVTSYVGHVELRSAHRRAMPLELLKSMNASRIFLLARIPQKEKYITQEAIQDESNTFGDILQGYFIENYRNLTYKHLMGLHWASKACKQALFILKVDDDTVFNLEKTYEYLVNISNLGNNDVLIGYMLNNTKPKRNKENKWYVSWDEYPWSDYPAYLSGWYYITTPTVATKISKEAVYHTYFWIDDIFLTGIIPKILNIKLVQLPINYWLEYYELLECCLKDMITKSIRCDHVVGPNGGRNNLIVEFNDAMRLCESRRNCTSRPRDQGLDKVCVAYRQRSIFSDGLPLVSHVKLK